MVKVIGTVIRQRLISRHRRRKRHQQCLCHRMNNGLNRKIGHILTSIVSFSPSLFTSADGSAREEEREQQCGALMPSSEDVPLMTSTPIVTSAPRSERDMEDALFGDIETLVREFLRRPDRRYPYYRIIRWTEGEQPKLEYVLTVVINRPAIVL